MKVSITGSGPIAMALALFLLRQGVPRHDIDIRVPEPDLPAGPAARSLALSDGSWQLLARIIEVPESAPINAVDIGVLGHGLHSVLKPADLGLPALGRVVRHGHLWRALALRCLQLGLQPATAPADDSTDDRLCIVADGRIENSDDVCDFDQSALTADLRLATGSKPWATKGRAPQPGVAYERFKPGGPIALLPLPASDQLSLVWCDRPERCLHWQSLDDSAFSDALAQCLGPRFARLEAATPRDVVPLRRVVAPCGGDTVLTIGNAAQALHPVAGQGMNLGIRDAFEAAGMIGDALANKKPASAVVKQFILHRNRDRTSTVRMTDMLAQLSERPHLLGLNNDATRSMALALLDSVPVLRRNAARRFVFGHRAAS